MAGETVLLGILSRYYEAFLLKNMNLNLHIFDTAGGKQVQSAYRQALAADVCAIDAAGGMDARVGSPVETLRAETGGSPCQWASSHQAQQARLR